ncbi:MAG TPA: hypothetical protein VGD80_01555, partial [Kofleriaceae bacterium]
TLLPLLLEERIWTVAQMLSYIRTIHDSFKQYYALSEIASKLPQDQHRAFIDVACTLHETRYAAPALASIAEHLSQAEVATYLSAVARFSDPAQRAELLLRLDTSSDVALRHRVLRMLDESRQSCLDPDPITELTITRLHHVEPALWQAVFDEAVHHARQIAAQERDRVNRTRVQVQALCRLADLSKDAATSAILAQQALDIWRAQLERDPDYIHAGGSPFAYCTATFARWVFSSAWSFAHQLDELTDRRRAIAELAGCFDATLWPAHAPEVMALVDSILARRPVSESIGELSPIVQQLSSDRLAALADVIAEMGVSHERWQLEILRLHRLPSDQQGAVAARIVDRLSELSDQGWSVDRRADAVAYLPMIGRRQAVEETLLASRSIRDHVSCSRAMGQLARELSGVSVPLSATALQLLLVEGVEFVHALRDPAACLTPGQVAETLTALGASKRLVPGRLTALLALAPAIKEETRARYQRCAEAFAHTPPERWAAAFALLGTVSLAAVDLDALHGWVQDLTFDDISEARRTLPPALSGAQIAFLADRVMQIRDGRARVFIGGCIADEIVRRGAWSWHLTDLRAQLRVKLEWEWFLLEPTLKRCSYAEARDLMDAAHAHVAPRIYLGLLDEVVQRAAGSHVDEVAAIVLSNLRDQLGRAVFVGRDTLSLLMQPLRMLCRWPMPPRAVDEVIALAETVDEGAAGRLRSCVAPWMNASQLDDHVARTRQLPVQERVKRLESALPRLSPALRQELHDDLMEWLETGRHDYEDLSLRLIEHTDVHPVNACKRLLGQPGFRNTIGVPASFARKFVAVLASWRAAGRVTEAEQRELISELFKRVALGDRASVVQLVAGLASGLDAMAAVAAVDVLNRIADVIHEWR